MNTNLCNPEASYKDIADTFDMSKTAIFNVLKRQPTGESAQGRGTTKALEGCLLPYPKEIGGQLVCLYNFEVYMVGYK